MRRPSSKRALRHVLHGLPLALVAQIAWAQPAEPRFPVQRYRVEGAVRVSVEELQSAVAPYTGPDKSFNDLQAARAAILAAYATRGWRAVDVVLPPQEIDSGEIRLVVVEKRVGRVEVKGNDANEARLRDAIQGLKEGEPPNVRAVDRSVHLINEGGVKQVSVSLAPARDESMVDATVSIQAAQPLQYFVALDNTGTPQTGQFRVGAGLRHGDLFGLDHTLNLQYVTAPHREGHPSQLALPPDHDVQIFGAAYRIPLFSLGDSVELTAAHSSVDSGTLQNLFTVSGSGTVYGLRYHHNLDRQGGLEHRLSIGIERRVYRNRLQVAGSATNLAPDITLHPLSLSYSAAMASAGAQTTFSIGVTHNIAGGSNGNAAAFDAARTGADARYTLLRAAMSRTQDLGSDVQVRLALDGQWTRDMLVQGEAFGLGGAYSIRGLREREIADDRGYRASAELYSPDYGPRIGSGVHLRMLAFTDAGRLRRVSPTGGEQAGQSVASAGVGARLSVGRGLSMRLDYGVVIDAGGNQGRGDGFMHGALSYVF